ncbi:MAG: glycosyltransferase family 4 protein [Tagaea sp.]|nr:glycosyltransferase family 4 protein [Tagaea sp.]
MKLRLVIPGSIDQATGGYRYAKRILEAWGDFPAPIVDGEPATCPTRRAPGETLLIDGLALPALYDRLPLRDCAALIHHPLGLENGRDDGLLARETAALTKIARIVVTSHATRRDLLGMGVHGAKIRVVEPGTRSARTAPARRGLPEILCVATLTPRKDHPTLLRALTRLRALRWRAVFVGPLDRDPTQTRKVRALIGSLRLGRRVRLMGERNEDGLAKAYARAHVFALPSRHEGYGMAFAEALAHRLPVAGVAAGAVPSVVPLHAGILVRPGDDRALARALVRLMRGRARYAANAARLRFPDWAEQAQRLRTALA